MHRFTSDELAAIRDLIGLPERLTHQARTGTSQVPIDEIRRALDLPDLPHRNLLQPDCWIAGGAVSRWLSRDPQNADYDFFFPSVETFNRRARWLMATHGCTFRAYRTFWTICQLCGRPGELIDQVPAGGDFSLPLSRIRCSRCGEFGGTDAATLEPERLLRITPQLITASGMRALELTAPDGAVFQLSPVRIRPTPLEMVAGFDFSIIQFAVDDKNLYYMPHAWTDLVTGRLRFTTDCRSPFFRLRKYMKRGFRPYAETVVRIMTAQVQQLWTLARNPRSWRVR
ncbi:MAG: hypothetical protein AAF657_03110 [Acidobacteriota bacterium]